MPPAAWHWLLLQLGDAIAGSGLFVVLALCSSKLNNLVSLGCVVFGLVVALAVRTSTSPILFRALNLLFNLVVSLSVCLNLFANLCSPEGKELALIPVYILLCVSRPGLTPLSGYVLALMSMVFVLVFLGVVSADPSVVESKLAVSLTSSDDPFLAGASIFIVTVYGGLSHMLPGYASDDDTPLSFVLTVVGGVCRLAVFAAVGLSKSALLSLFLAMPRPHSLHPRPPNYLAAYYGVCLLIACMHMASVWFEELKGLTCLLSGRAYTARRLVRLQHIVNAGLVGAAWGFPLHLSELRVILAGCLLLQIFFSVRGGEGR